MPRLLINPGTPQQWEIALKPGLNTLGRNPACDFQIEEASISGTHCHIVVNGDTVLVKDLGSTNGTFIERAPVSESPLTAGQQLRLGSVEMQLVADAASVPSASPAPAALRVSKPASAAAPAAHGSAPAPPLPPTAVTGKPGLRLSVAAHAAPAAPSEAVAAVADSQKSGSRLPDDDPEKWGPGGKGDTWKWWYYVLAGVCFAGYDIWKTIDTGRLKYLGGLFLAVLLIAIGFWDFQRKRKKHRSRR